MLVQGLNSLHQISERVCISLWHMAYKELFEPIDASISLWCFVIWIRGEVKCKCVFALHARYVILFSFFSVEHCMGEPHRGRVELYLWGAAICGEQLSVLARPDTQQFAAHCRGRKHRAGTAPPLKPKRQLAVTQFFSAAPPRVAEEVPPPIESDGEDEVAANDPETQGTATTGTSAWEPPPLGIPNANALRGKYPVMRHAYEKVHSRYVDGMGIVSLDPPCTGKARFGDSGEKLPCNPCYEVPRNKALCKWMREGRSADFGT